MPATDTLEVTPLPAPFRASVRPPGSKSLTNRALLLAALAEGTSTLDNVLLADDTRRMLEALPKLGVSVELDEASPRATITGLGPRWQVHDAEPTELFLGNAGTAYRFLTAACCLGSGSFRLTGIPRMHQRPVGQLVDALRQIGAHIDYEGEEGYPPLRITARGPLPGGELTMAPTLSSQYVSALLMIGPLCEQGLTIRFDGPITSRPYVDMTLGLMHRFDAPPRPDTDYTELCLSPQSYRPQHLAIEPDASNASYFLAAAAICPGSSCTIQGLGRGSLQGDVGFADVLHQMGAGLLFGQDFIQVMAPPDDEPLRGLDVDLADMPDMAQTLAVVALFARGPSAIRRVGNLRVKETDRLAALRTELTKLGATVDVDGDDLLIDPPAYGELTPAAIDTYDDHRMAMSFAVAGLRHPGIRINDPGCVAKTYPGFFQALEQLRHQPATPSYTTGESS